MLTTLVTLQLMTAGPSPIERVAWLAGTWESKRDGSYAEEVWSPPKAGAMLGMFRLIKGENTEFVEISTIRVVGADIELRIRHFNDDLEPWPHEKTPLIYRSTKITPNQVIFESRTDRMRFFELQHDPKNKKLTVRLRPRDGGKPLEFHFTRR